MYRAAIIADDNLAPAFRALGFDAWTAATSRQARQAWREVAAGQYAIVFVTEPVYEHVSDLVDELGDAGRSLPLVTVLPSREGTSGRNLAELKARVEKAIGVDILFKGEES